MCGLTILTSCFDCWEIHEQIEFDSVMVVSDTLKHCNILSISVVLPNASYMQAKTMPNEHYADKPMTMACPSFGPQSNLIQVPEMF